MLALGAQPVQVSMTDRQNARVKQQCEPEIEQQHEAAAYQAVT